MHIINVELTNPYMSRIPANRDDFGDRATWGACLRERDKDPLKDGRTGRFLGQGQHGKWGVAYYTSDNPFTTAGIEEYQTLEALKSVWELD